MFTKRCIASFLTNLFCAGLIRGQAPQISLPLGHTKEISTIDYSPDGKYIITASDDNTAVLWEAASGKLLYKLQEHSSRVTSAKFNSDGKYIVTTSFDRYAIIWDVMTGKLLFKLPGHKSEIYYAEFSPDGKYVVTASRDKSAIIWKTESGSIHSQLKKHRSTVSSAHFSADGRYVVTASNDSTAALWDVSSGKWLQSLTAHTGKINSANFNVNGNIVTASDDSTVIIWDTAGQFLQRLPAQANKVIFAGFSRTARYLLTINRDTAEGLKDTTFVWDSTGTLLWKFAGHSKKINSACFSPNEKYVVTASSDNTAIVWNIATGSIVHKLRGYAWEVNQAIFSPDESSVLLASYNKALIYDALTGKLVNKLEGYSRRVFNAKITPEGKNFVSVLDDNSITVREVSSGKLLHQLHQKGPITFANLSDDGKYLLSSASNINKVIIWDLATGKRFRELAGHNKKVNSANFSPDGNFIVTASNDRTAILWDTAGNIIHQIAEYSDDVEYAGFSPNGKYILTVSKDTATLWDTSGALVQKLENHERRINYAGFSTKGNFIVTASDDNRAAIWDSSGKMLHILSEHSKAVSSASFSADSKRLVTSSWDKTARIWDTNGTSLHILEGHSGRINSAVFSPDGKYIVTASDDKTAAVWDAFTGQRLFKLAGHSHMVVSANFSPDGSYIVTNSEDNTLKFWQTSTGSLLFTFITLENNHYLVLDGAGRYDGTDPARKFIHYTCNAEVIELDQFKELSWEPGLASKIMGVNKEAITAKKLSEIDLCRFTPNVESKKDTTGVFRFNVIAQKGGLGNVLLFVNGKNIKTYTPDQLTKLDTSYTFTVNEKDIADYLITDAENKLEVKALTANGQMESRGVVVTAFNDNITDKNTHEPPNVYILSVGISQYKGDKLRLAYAAKDAVDFSGTITAASKKLFNIQDSNHVFTYLFSTEEGDYYKPSKANIKSRFDSISRQAKANDILIIFFAGHGMVGSNKLFYYLSQEAASLDITGFEKDVAISSEELARWMNKIKAQKQLLILDACNSGQVVQEMKEIISKREIPADQQRALERLRDRTGTYILSAATATQAAFETSLYGQGLLTYSLLYGIKFGECLKDKQFIDVAQWYNFAVDKVTLLAKDIGGRQDPQMLGPASFEIGKVDSEVAEAIKLSDEKVIFDASKFRPLGESLDTLAFSDLIDNQLLQLGSRGKECPFVFVKGNTFSKAYSLDGYYGTSNDTLTAKVAILKGAKELVEKFEMSRPISQKEELASEIATRVKNYFSKRKNI